MKNSNLNFIGFLLLLVYPAIQVHAQAVSGKDQVQFNIFEFEGTDKYDLIFPVTGQQDSLKIKINAFITAGDLSVEIYDPSGEKLGNLTVRGKSGLKKSSTYNFISRTHSENTTRMNIEKEPDYYSLDGDSYKHHGMNKNVTRAGISKLFNSPMPGNWVIKADCIRAKGFFSIENNGYLLKSNMPVEFVSGIVVNGKNMPIAGATIRSKNRYGMTTSDSNGAFTVSLPDEAESRGEPEIFIVSYRNMIKEVTIAGQPDLKVVLEH